MLSDCIECWSTPCVCGYDYKDYPKEYFIKFILDITSKNVYQQEIIEEVYKQLKIIDNVQTSK